MVLDLDLFRPDKGGDPERVRANVRKRFDNEESVDKIMELDSQWRTIRWSLDQLNKKKNQISKEYGAKMKSGPAPAELEQLKKERLQVDTQVVDLTKQLEECETQRHEILKEIGNLIHNDVPVSNNEDENAIVKEFGTDKILKAEDIGVDKLLSHVDLIEMIEGLNTEKGSMISGSRGYFLTGPAIWLQQALIQYALRYLDDVNFQLIYTPFWMRKTIMGQVAQLTQFNDELYKLTSEEDGEEKYLIATSEQPIAAFHLNEWLPAQSLPLRYGGYSTCFRQEVGSHGRDTRGIFRVHQFEKLEQFIISSPSTSWEHFHEMIGNSQKFYENLGLPYRVVNIVSGALNNAAAMKYDLEAYFPGSQAYRELVSVSNCTDYQSRRLQIRYGQTKKMSGQVEYVHMLNGTLCAVTRVICCILENYQTKEGIRIPDVLQPFMPARFKSFIPFTQPVPTATSASTNKP